MFKAKVIPREYQSSIKCLLYFHQGHCISWECFKMCFLSIPVSTPHQVNFPAQLLTFLERTHSCWENPLRKRHKYPQVLFHLFPFELDIPGPGASRVLTHNSQQVSRSNHVHLPVIYLRLNFRPLLNLTVLLIHWMTPAFS